jgi:hypothetical protein
MSSEQLVDIVFIVIDVTLIVVSIQIDEVFDLDTLSAPSSTYPSRGSYLTTWF